MLGCTSNLTDFEGFVNTGLMVHVYMADPLTVTKNRNALSCSLNISDQLRRATGNDQVDHLLQTTQILHIFTCAYLNTQGSICDISEYREDKLRQILT